MSIEERMIINYNLRQPSYKKEKGSVGAYENKAALHTTEDSQTVKYLWSFFDKVGTIGICGSCTKPAHLKVGRIRWKDANLL